MQRLTYCLIASLAALFGVSPALAQHANKTELVTFDGASVDRIQMRETIDAAWVIDTQNILYRDGSREHYLVTLRQACKRLALQQPFSFEPSDSRELRATRTYEVLPQAGPPCEVAKIAQIDPARAKGLRDQARRREG